MKTKNYSSFASVLMLLFFATFTAQSQTPFFSENFNNGIPTNWSRGGTTLFVACDSNCLKDYDVRYSSGFYDFINDLDDPQRGIGGTSFKKGTATLRTIRKVGLASTLTTPVVNCAGKSKVFLRFATVQWTASNSDNPQGIGNAATTCLVRVSRNGLSWKEYKIFNSNRREGLPVLMDISEVAANRDSVFVQFIRTGDEDNAIWAIDEVGLLAAAPVRGITVSVDMSSEKMSPKGVYIASDISGEWKPNAQKMTAMGGGIYKVTMPVPQLTTVHYKFMNGDSWGENESVLSGCGELNIWGTYDRVARSERTDFEVETVCFGACMQCGNRKSELGFEFCSNDPSLIYCDNFEARQLGKLVPQTTNWTTFSLAFGGKNLATATDNPTVTSYWQGFTNYDGSRALRVVGDPVSGVSDNPLLYLGNPTEGSFQIDFRMYVPKNRSAVISLDDSTSRSGFTLDFSNDVLSVLSFIDYFTLKPNLLGKSVKYKQDDWNAISIVFNAKTNKIALKLNNLLVLDVVNPAQTGYGFLDLSANDVISRFNLKTEFYVDNITYKRIPTTFNLTQNNALNATTRISPNPANDKINVSIDQEKDSNWTMRMFNTVGQIVFTQSGESSQTLQIDSRNLQNGLYILEIQTASERKTERVVVQH